MPQGGVLSPLLFTLFVNDLPDFITPSCLVLQYADDVKLISTCTDPDTIKDTLSIAISRLNEWCIKWHLRLNPKKSKICYFTKSNHDKNNPKSLKCNNTEIPYVNTVKDLEVWFDSKITFENHTTRLLKSLRTSLGMFWRNLTPIRGTNAIRTAFHALVQSQIDYGLPIWGIAAPTHLHAIEATHRKFLRFILNIPHDDHTQSYEELTQAAKTFTLQSRYEYLTLNLAHTLVNHLPSLTNLSLTRANSQRSTRSHTRYYILFFRLDSTRRSFLYITPHILNLLVEDLDLVSIPKHIFKKLLKEFLLDSI